MAEIRKDIEEGYCTKHGYDWCECLKAIEEQETKLASMFKKDKKKRRVKK